MLSFEVGPKTTFCSLIWVGDMTGLTRFTPGDAGVENADCLSSFGDGGKGFDGGLLWSPVEYFLGGY